MPPTEAIRLETMPRNWLGPRLITAFFMCIETGIVINQSSRFWSDAHAERLAIRILVTWVTVVALFHTCVLIWDAWNTFIVHFSDFLLANRPTWASRATGLIVATMAIPVQSFYTWRCWKLTNNRFVLVFLSMLCAAYLATSLCATVYLMRYNFDRVHELQPGELVSFEPWKPDPFVAAALVIPAVLDIGISSILFIFLWTSRPEHTTRQFRKMLRRIIVLIWESAIPPCACAIISLIAYLAMPDNYWSLLFRVVLGQLYVISLFVSLNGLNEMRNRSLGISPTSALEKNSLIEHISDVEMRVSHINDSVTSYSQPRRPRNSLSVEAQQRPEDSHAIDVVMMGVPPFDAVLGEESCLRKVSSGTARTSNASVTAYG